MAGVDVNMGCPKDYSVKVTGYLSNLDEIILCL